MYIPGKKVFHVRDIVPQVIQLCPITEAFALLVRFWENPPDNAFKISTDFRTAKQRELQPWQFWVISSS
jgi:hypothetical protein